VIVVTAEFLWSVKEIPVSPQRRSLVHPETKNTVEEVT